jgi:hypothetical protein
MFCSGHPASRKSCVELHDEKLICGRLARFFRIGTRGPLALSIAKPQKTEPLHDRKRCSVVTFLMMS